MTLAEILSRSATLPPAQQQEIVDFAEFLLHRYGQQNAAPQPTGGESLAAWADGSTPLREITDPEKEPAYGIWAERTDITDSVEYVRQLRKDQWQRQR